MTTRGVGSASRASSALRSQGSGRACYKRGMTKRLGWFVIACALGGLGCGGADSGASGGSTGGGSTGQASGGGEVAGETEGFDMEGFEDSGEPQVDHGTQSARQLLGVRPPPMEFDEMSHDDQVYWMVSNVLPIAAEDFRGYDSERFATATCALCHGENAEDADYEMPSAQLPRLPAPGSPQWTQMQGGRAYAFMNDVVTPTMATLIGEERYSQEHPDGFGCFGCHTQRQ